MIRMLFDLTGIDPTKVPLDDKETMSIFSSTKALGVTPEQIRSEVGSYRNTRVCIELARIPIIKPIKSIVSHKNVHN